MLNLRAGTAAVLVTVALLAGCAPASVPLREGRASISLGEPPLFYESGASLSLTVQIFNPGEDTLQADSDLWGGRHFLVTDRDGRALESIDDRTAPSTLIPPKGRVSSTVDFLRLFPALIEPGEYTLIAEFPQFRSNRIKLNIIPSYDPEVQYSARVETDRGAFTLGFFPEVAPEHVHNFINLARSGYYNGNIVHRVMPGVMFQTGDPTSTGRGGPGWTLRAEFNRHPHQRGALSMARNASDPHSAGSQWFVCLDRVPEWDGEYTVFGQVTEGMDVVDLIGNLQVKGEVPQDAVTIQHIVVSAGESSVPR